MTTFHNGRSRAANKARGQNTTEGGTDSGLGCCSVPPLQCAEMPDLIFRAFFDRDDFAKPSPELVCAATQHLEGCTSCMKKYLALEVTFNLAGDAAETASPLMRQLAEEVKAAKRRKS
jgi:hypothetical protein